MSVSDNDWDEDDDWPDDDEPAESWPHHGGQGQPWPVGSGGQGRPGAPGDEPRRRGARVAAVVAMVFAAAGIGGAAVIVARDLSAPQTATPASAPSQQIPAQPGGNGLPTGPGSGGGALPGPGAQMFVAGPVTAVSSTSITIGGPMRSITAAVTSTTKVTGNVSSISSVKVGDQVSAQLAQSGSTVTAVAIQDPARQPGAGNAP